MILHLVLAALTLCGDAGAQLQSAQTLLAQAQSLVEARRPGAVEPYRRAAQLLAALPDTAGSSCDPDEYLLSRLNAELRSVILDVETGGIQPVEAYRRMAAAERRLHTENVASRFQSLTSERYALTRLIRKGARAQLTAAPFPSSAPCDVPDFDVETSSTSAVQFPNAARDVGGAVTTRVKVLVDAAGHVAAATIIDSSGNMYIDNAALDAARNSTYLPAIKNCRPAAQSYNFAVTFDPNQ